jgi:NTE family protein
LGYEAGFLNATRFAGSPLLPSVSGRTGATRLRIVTDRLNEPIIPRSGVFALGEGGWVDANPGATNGFPSAQALVEGFVPATAKDTVYGVASGGTTFGREQVGLPQFTLGGPARLAAYGINQFLVNQYFYFRLGYLHQIGELKPFLGGPVYFQAAYEIAKPYTLAGDSRLAMDGTAGIVLQTVLGPVLIGGAIGESGNRAWFFQLGRIF